MIQENAFEDLNYKNVGRCVWVLMDKGTLSNSSNGWNITKCLTHIVRVAQLHYTSIYPCDIGASVGSDLWACSYMYL